MIKITEKELKAIVLVATLVAAIAIASWPVVAVFFGILALVGLDEINVNKDLRSALNTLANNQTDLDKRFNNQFELILAIKKENEAIQKNAEELKKLVAQTNIANILPQHPGARRPGGQ